MVAEGAWSSVRLHDVPALDGAGPADWKPLRHHFGIRSFGVNAWVAREAGQQLIEEHDGADAEELYAVTHGRATVFVGDERIDAPAGTLVHVADPRVRRSAVADEPGTTVLAIGVLPRLVPMRG